jgi:hypothetical protein
MANGVDALDFGLDVGPGGVDQFQIIYSRKDSRISGQMTASKTARCFAVAFPRDSRYWLPGARRVKTAAPDLNGAFVFFGLPPGEYLIAASPETGTETPDWPTATTLSALVPFGVSLQLASGGTPRVNLSCR